MDDAFTIRLYRGDDESAWLRCRVLAFLGTAFYDSVERQKPVYDNPSIELVAERDGRLVGLIDVELEETPGSICRKRDAPSGMIWNVASDPDLRRLGIGRALVDAAASSARDRGMGWLEAWTRDDDFVRKWYEAMGFVRFDSYLHVFLSSGVQIDDPDLIPIETFAHYVGPDRDRIRQRYDRVHECCAYEIRL